MLFLFVPREKKPSSGIPISIVLSPRHPIPVLVAADDIASLRKLRKGLNVADLPKVSFPSP
jgi:hypothetical protein